MSSMGSKTCPLPWLACTRLPAPVNCRCGLTANENTRNRRLNFRASDTQELSRICLQYLRPDLVADLELGEIRYPAIGRDHRPVRTEQHLVLQNAVDVAHQDRRK